MYINNYIFKFKLKLSFLFSLIKNTMQYCKYNNLWAHRHEASCVKTLIYENAYNYVNLSEI